VVKVSIPQERFNDIFKKLSDRDKEQAIDFVEFLYEKRKKAWYEILENVSEDDEELSSKEINALQEAEKDLKAGKTRSLAEAMGELEV
jgi:hypothetical protein